MVQADPTSTSNDAVKEQIQAFSASIVANNTE